MSACLFEAVIENGAIRVPDEYLEAGVRKVRVLPDAPRAAGKPRFFPDLKFSPRETRFDRKRPMRDKVQKALFGKIIPCREM